MLVKPQNPGLQLNKSLVIPEGQSLWRGLKLCFPLWEGGGVLHDISGFENDGELGDAGAGVPIRERDGFEYTKAGASRIKLTGALADVSGKPSTAMFRARWDSQDTNGAVWLGTTTGATNFWQITQGGDCFINGSSIGNVGSWVDGIEHTFAFVTDGTTGSFWVDGVKVLSSAHSPTAIAAGAKDFLICEWIAGPGSNFTFEGGLRAFAFWDRGLNDNEAAVNFFDIFDYDESYEDQASWLSADTAAAAGGAIFSPYYQYYKNMVAA